MLRATLLLVMASALGGCARYQYRIIEPPEIVRTIGTKTDEVVTLGTLDYNLRTVDNRLVMRIYNRGQTVVELLGSESYVVAPDGETHPLPRGLIAPGAFGKLILPPREPQPVRRGPSIGFGVGVGISQAEPPPATQAPAAPRPIYLQASAPEDYYWRWKDEGQIRLSLSFRTETEAFRQDFVIARIKT